MLNDILIFGSGVCLTSSVYMLIDRKWATFILNLVISILCLGLAAIGE